MRNKLFESDSFYFFLTFFLVYAGSNTLFAQVVLSTQISIVLIALVLFALFITKNRLHAVRTAIFSAVILVSIIAISAFLNADADNFFGEMIIVLKILCGLMLFSCFDRVRIMRMFSVTIVIIAAASLIITFLFPLFSLEKLFPTIINSSGIRFYNCFLSLKIDSYGFYSMRNYGIFSEPAVYCFYLLIASFSTLFFFPPSAKKFFSLVLLSVTLFTTFSPIGLLGAFVFTLLAMVDMVSAGNMTQLRKAGLVLLMMIIGAFVILILTNQSVFDMAISKSDLSTGSGQGRLESIYYDLAYWSRHPVFGGSLKTLNIVTNQLGFNTSTTGSMLLSFGVFFGGLATALQFISVKFFTFGRSRMTTAIIFTVFILAINNHSYIQNDWYWYFTFAGICGGFDRQ